MDLSGSAHVTEKWVLLKSVIKSFDYFKVLEYSLVVLLISLTAQCWSTHRPLPQNQCVWGWLTDGEVRGKNRPEIAWAGSWNCQVSSGQATQAISSSHSETKPYAAFTSVSLKRQNKNPLAKGFGSKWVSFNKEVCRGCELTRDGQMSWGRKLAPSWPWSNVLEGTVVSSLSLWFRRGFETSHTSASICSVKALGFGREWKQWTILQLPLRERCPCLTNRERAPSSRFPGSEGWVSGHPTVHERLRD